MLDISKPKTFKYGNYAIAFILFASASHNVCAESIKTSTVAVTIVDRVGNPRGLTIRLVDKFNNVVAAEASNVSSSVFTVKEGSYDVNVKCQDGISKTRGVTLLHDCAKNETAGSLCQGETAVIAISCN